MGCRRYASAQHAGLCSRQRCGEAQVALERMARRERVEALRALGEHVGVHRAKGRNIRDLAADRADLDNLCCHSL